jgi:hypothetical protein
MQIESQWTATRRERAGVPLCVAKCPLKQNRLEWATVSALSLAWATRPSFLLDFVVWTTRPGARLTISETLYGVRGSINKQT